LVIPMNAAVKAALSLVVCLVATLAPASAGAQPPKPLLVWGGDAEGGEPFVYADPDDTSRVIGFEVDIAQLLADGLGRAPRFQQVAYVSLDAAAQRGDFDVGLSGIEDLPARKARLALTVPYYQFRELLTVRQADGARFRTLADLHGRRVATLGATLG
jgi:polar amino acid transport system substrate-binding protein